MAQIFADILRVRAIFQARQETRDQRGQGQSQSSTLQEREALSAGQDGQDPRHLLDGMGDVMKAGAAGVGERTDNKGERWPSLHAAHCGQMRCRGR